MAKFNPGDKIELNVDIYFGQRLRHIPSGFNNFQTKASKGEKGTIKGINSTGGAYSLPAYWIEMDYNIFSSGIVAISKEFLAIENELILDKSFYGTQAPVQSVTPSKPSTAITASNGNLPPGTIVTSVSTPKIGDEVVIKPNCEISPMYSNLHAIIDGVDASTINETNPLYKRWKAHFIGENVGQRSLMRKWFDIVGDKPTVKKEEGCTCGAHKTYNAPKGSPLHTMPGRGLAGCNWAPKDNLKNAN